MRFFSPEDLGDGGRPEVGGFESTKAVVFVLAVVIMRVRLFGPLACMCDLKQHQQQQSFLAAFCFFSASLFFGGVVGEGG